MSKGPFYDAEAVTIHDMMLEEWGEEFCPIASCWICQGRREVIKENEARPGPVRQGEVWRGEAR